MAVWTPLSFSALTVLHALELNQMQANFTALVQAAAGIPTWTKVTIKPGSAVWALIVDQDYDAIALEIDVAAASTKTCLQIINAGSGNDIVSPNFTLKNGYIAPGGLEALRWDVVEVVSDGTQLQIVAGDFDETKVRILIFGTYDNSLDDFISVTDNALAIWTDGYINDGDVTFEYGAQFAAPDVHYALVGSVA